MMNTEKYGTFQYRKNRLERERIETHISTCNNMFERVECQYSRWRDNFFASCNPQIPHLLNDDQ